MERKSSGRAQLRPLIWHKMPNADEWHSNCFAGWGAYGIRQMRDGRFAVMIGSTHRPAVMTWDDAVYMCEEDRWERMLGEFASE